VGKELIINDPSCKFVPLIDRPSINRDAPFNHLIFTRLKIGDDFFGNLGKVSTIDKVVRLQENSPQPGFSNRIVLKIELVESMERIRMGLFKSIFAIFR
jgi:hypothetical protein